MEPLTGVQALKAESGSRVVGEGRVPLQGGNEPLEDVEEEEHG